MKVQVVSPRPELTHSVLARERLAAGVDLFIECSSNADHIVSPRWVRARINLNSLVRILELQAACSDHGLTVAESNGGPAHYDTSNTLVKNWRVRVDVEDFWFHGRPSGRGSVQSSMVPIDGLCCALGAPAVPGAAAAGRNADNSFHWYGGALVHADPFTEAADFILLLNESLPDLAARERELIMQAKLDEQRGAAPPPASGLPASRRAAI